MNVEIADLLFVKNQHGFMDDAIAASTGSYVHVAMMIDDKNIIEATPMNGVIISELGDFLSMNKHVDIYRTMISNAEKDIVVQQAGRFVGEPYNESFYLNGEGKYCSELIVAAFEGVITFPTVPMNFGDGKHSASAYWQNYFEKLGVDVPVNMPGTNPTQLSQSVELKYMGTLSMGWIPQVKTKLL